jgi:hypothetical protein
LLDRFGYKDRDGDGFRETPDGKPLTLAQSSLPDSLSREGDTLWLKNMTAIGLAMTVNTQQFSDLLRQSKAGQLMMFNLGFRASEPSGYSLLATLWGKSGPDINHSRFRNADYDAAFEQFLRTPDGPARLRSRKKMSERRQRVRADRAAGQSGRQRVRAALASGLLPVAVRLHVEVHGHRSRKEIRGFSQPRKSQMKQKILVVVQEYPQVSETYIKNEVDALAERFDLELLALVPGSYPYRSRRPHIVLSPGEPAEHPRLSEGIRSDVVHGHYLTVLGAVDEDRACPRRSLHDPGALVRRLGG